MRSGFVQAEKIPYRSIKFEIQHFLRSLRGSGANRNRYRAVQTGPNVRSVCVGPYRLSNGLCRILNSASAGTDLMPVQASWTGISGPL
jgi:hypothetical protein